MRKGSWFPSPIVRKGCRFPSPVLEKGCRFPSPVLEKGSIGSSVQYWVKVVYVLKSNTGKYVLGSLSSTGKGSIGSSVQYWEKVL